MSGPLPAFLSPFTVPASWLYGLAVRARNERFDRGRGLESVDVPVISVGNLTTGGSGKTPMVAWIADCLVAEGHRPLIAMRGYRARPPQKSDEEAEYAKRLPRVPVAANPDRVAGVRAALAERPSIDCVLLDDGFQHRRLKRDLDLVLVDASRDTLVDRLLPAGHLREPPRSLERADAVVVTRARRLDPALGEAIAKHHGRAPVAWSRHTWSSLAVWGPRRRCEPVEFLRGRRVLAMLGVGHPGSIIDQLEEAGAEVSVSMPVADHERYDRPKLALARSLCAGVDLMFMTAKDRVKVEPLTDLGAWPVPVVVPELVIDVFDGAEALRALILETVTKRVTK